MNILVTGANGQLGNEIRIVARESRKDHYIFTDVTDVEGLSTSRLDMTDAEAVRTMVREQNVRVIINCAAYTNVDAAESNLYAAELLNAKAPVILAEAMREVGGVLVHISTDYVFGGEPYNTPCREDQKGTPTGVYGRTKLQGEEGITATGCRHLIFRTAWLYSEYGKNFVKTMLSLTSSKPQISVVCDQTGTPTYALDLARAIFKIVSERLYDGRSGVYNYSNEGVCSWFDFARLIGEMAGNVGCEVLPCRSSEFPSKVVRPAYSVLDKTKIKQTFGVDVPYWTDSLKACLTNLLGR